MNPKNLVRLGVMAAVLSLAACSPKKENQSNTIPQSDTTMKLVTKTPFGQTADGQAVDLYTLTNRQGMSLSVMNYGGIVVRLTAPDKQGKSADIVLGFDSLSGYEAGSPYFGALVGRYGNRIAKGKFKLDGVEYKLAVNNGDNALHGGLKGFDKVLWNIEEIPSSEGASVKLTYQSKDGEEGYPGTLSTEVTYTLTHQNEWKITYKATTDKKTVVNLTQHTYFNLTGDPNNDILGHELTLAADKFLPVDKGLIPTGELKPVAGTPFDFTKGAVIGSRINDKDAQLAAGKGYDHCFVLTGADGTLRPFATVYEPTTGRTLEVSTTEPAVQFYTGNFLDGSKVGKDGIAYAFRHGFCLETEHFPDSPNQAAFPTVVLEPGKTYETTTVYKFGVR
jgi:aldose 1-epimerase